MGRPTAIIIHHEAGSNGFDGVNEYHRQLWNFKSSLGFWIGYQYYIDKAGKIWQGRRDDEEGAHTKGRNNDSIGICLEGNNDHEKPTAMQMAALKELLLRRMTYWAIPASNIFGHRMYANKSCPGNLLRESELRALFQPDMSYIQAMINSIKDTLNRLSMRKVGSASSCITKETKD